MKCCNSSLKLSIFKGVRLAIHAANRLIREDGQYACIAACAAGGQVWAKFICLLFGTLINMWGSPRLYGLVLLPLCDLNSVPRRKKPDFQGSR